MKVKRLEQKELFDVRAWNGKVILKTQKNIIEENMGLPDFEIRLSKKEAQALANALRAQAKRKGVK